jgi:hypothetical protein
MGPFDGALLYDLSTWPDIDGISLLVDFCPGADADCLCDVVVGAVIPPMTARGWRGATSKAFESIAKETCERGYQGTRVDGSIQGGHAQVASYTPRR